MSVMNSEIKVPDILNIGSLGGRIDLIKVGLSFVDLATLNGSDTNKTVIDLCDKGKTIIQDV